MPERRSLLIVEDSEVVAVACQVHLDPLGTEVAAPRSASVFITPRGSGNSGVWQLFEEASCSFFGKKEPKKL